MGLSGCLFLVHHRLHVMHSCAYNTSHQYCKQEQDWSIYYMIHTDHLIRWSYEDRATNERKRVILAAVPRVQTHRIFKPGLFSLPIFKHCIKNNHSNFISNDKLNTTVTNQKPPRPIIDKFLNWTKSKQEQAFISS